MISPGLIGTRALDIDTPTYLRDQLSILPDDRPDESRDQLVLHAFQGDDRTLVFLSSRSDTDMTIRLDHADLVPNFTHLWGQKLSVIDDPATLINEGDPTAPFAKPYVTTMTQEEMQHNELLQVEIGPYEIIRLDFTMNDLGVNLRGHDQVVDPTADYDDVLLGGSGDDLIQDFFGNNLLRGGAGNDTIIGGVGNDTIGGDSGDDLLIGGGGINQIFGGYGNDTLVGSSLGGFMKGGPEGANHFIVSILGRTVIDGFRPEDGSTLSFFRAYDQISDVRDVMEIDGDDIILLHEQGITRLLDAAGKIDFFEESLADFQHNSPVNGVLD